MTYGRLAQLVEHLLDVQEVTGSSPVPSTKTTRLIRVGSFCFGGRYRTRTAAEATAACGGNREPRLGQRSDFSKPCQGAAEKSANATRTGTSRQILLRFPTARNVYRDACCSMVDGTGLEPEQAKAGYHRGDGILPFVLYDAFGGNRCVRAYREPVHLWQGVTH